jgi:O-antigen/teichoic acid export membrane protein
MGLGVARKTSRPERGSARGLGRRICGNAACLLSGKAAAGVVSLAYISFGAHALGPRGYGVLNLAYGFAMLVGGIVRLQPGPTLVRYGALALAAGDRGRLTTLLRRFAVLEIAVAAAGAGAAALLSGLAAPRIGWPWGLGSLALFVGVAALATVRSTPGAVLQLLGRFDLLGVQIAVEPVARLAGVLLVIGLGLGLPGFLAVWAAAVLVECSAMWGTAAVVARRRLGRQAVRAGPAAAAAPEAGLWKFLAASNADLTLREVTGRLPTLTVGWVLGPAAAGLYAIAVRATNVLVHPAQVLADAAYAEFARHFAGADGTADVRRWTAVVLGGCWSVALPVLAVLLTLGPQIARALGGVRFLAAADVIAWLGLACVVRLAVPTLSGALAAQGRAGAALFVNLVSAVALFPLLPLLLVRLSVVGAGAFALIQAVTALALVTALLVGPGLRASGPRPDRLRPWPSANPARPPRIAAAYASRRAPVNGARPCIRD